MSLHFDCPFCTYSKKVPDSYYKKKIKCPRCLATVTLGIPQPTALTALPLPEQLISQQAIEVEASAFMTRCPYCNKFINAEEQKCPYCHAMILQDVIPENATSNHDSSQINMLRVDSSQQLNAVQSDSSQQLNAVQSDSSQQLNAVKSDSSQQLNAVKSDSSQQLNAVQSDSSQQLNAVQSDNSQVDTVQSDNAPLNDEQANNAQTIQSNTETNELDSKIKSSIKRCKRLNLLSFIPFLGPFIGIFSLIYCMIISRKYTKKA